MNKELHFNKDGDQTQHKHHLLHKTLKMSREHRYNTSYSYKNIYEMDIEITLVLQTGKLNCVIVLC